MISQIYNHLIRSNEYGVYMKNGLVRWFPTRAEAEAWIKLHKFEVR